MKCVRIKKADEISMGYILGRTCRTHEEKRECIQDIYGRKTKSRTYLDVGEKIILKWILRDRMG
jgi:hypothetical protein